MKTKMKRTIAVIMCVMTVFASPSISFAASTASTLEELVREVVKYGMKREKSFKIKYTGKESEIDDFYDDVLYYFYNVMSVQDDPDTSDDADYLVGTIDYTKSLDMKADENGNMTFKMSYYETLKQTNTVNERIPEILDELGVANMSNYKKVKTIHDYLCNLITYEDGTDENRVFSAYGGLINHSAVCNSYSLCLYKLLVEAGVPCKYVSGTAKDSGGSGGHAWNIVALGDKWYYVDTTWDDEDPGVSHDYFLKGTSDFDESDSNASHTLDPEYKRAPFSKVFPIARNSFNPTMMSDENNMITIGGTDPGDSKDPGYLWGDIVEGKDPSSGKFTVKKNKNKDLWVFIRKNAAKLVKKMTYKVTKGKANIKNIKNYGVYKYKKEYFGLLSFKGKKKGNVNIKITLKLTNGQRLSYTFKGKVK